MVMNLQTAFNGVYSFSELYKFITEDCNISDLMALRAAFLDPDPKTRWTPGVHDWCEQYHSNRFLNIISGRIRALRRMAS